MSSIYNKATTTSSRDGPAPIAINTSSNAATSTASTTTEEVATSGQAPTPGAEGNAYSFATSNAVPPGYTGHVSEGMGSGIMGTQTGTDSTNLPYYNSATVPDPYLFSNDDLATFVDSNTYFTTQTITGSQQMSAADQAFQRALGDKSLVQNLGEGLWNMKDLILTAVTGGTYAEGAAAAESLVGVLEGATSLGDALQGLSNISDVAGLLESGASLQGAGQVFTKGLAGIEGILESNFKGLGQVTAVIGKGLEDFYQGNQTFHDVIDTLNQYTGIPSALASAETAMVNMDMDFAAGNWVQGIQDITPDLSEIANWDWGGGW